MSELKPCPFCGGKAFTSTFFDWDDLEYMPIEVNDCDAEVTCENERCINGWYLSPKAWNTRPIEDALNARIAELEAAQRWIPVSERLPEKQKLTIGFTDNSAYVFFEIVNDDEMGLVMYPYQNRKGTVTHWMPLPTPPEDK